MKLKQLECVVLERDIPEHRLRRGDVGTVVEVYPRGGAEVEFVRASGRTQAVLTLSAEQVRKIAADDLLAVRKLQKKPS
jgi:hypothetical protein